MSKLLYSKTNFAFDFLASLYANEYCSFNNIVWTIEKYLSMFMVKRVDTDMPQKIHQATHKWTWCKQNSVSLRVEQLFPLQNRFRIAPWSWNKIYSTSEFKIIPVTETSEPTTQPNNNNNLLMIHFRENIQWIYKL